MKNVVRRLTENEKTLSEIEIYYAELEGKDVWFTDERIKLFPENCGLYKYEIRHADDDWDDPCEISTKISVNFYGTVITTENLILPNTSLNGLKYDDIENFVVDYGEAMSVLDLINNKRIQDETKTNQSS